MVCYHGPLSLRLEKTMPGMVTSALLCRPILQDVMRADTTVLRNYRRGQNAISLTIINS